jgi:glycosyltransferase involved in cell wall biosynthesis
MKRLLAINWEMPPLSGPRAVQVSRTLTHLVPLGWQSSVVCFGPTSNRYNQDRDLAAQLIGPDGVTLVPVRSLEERFFFRALWRVCPWLKKLPDEKWVWIRPATRTASRLARERPFDVLISYGQPWSDHLIGARVHDATGLPWVAHFSDPWTDSPYLRGPRWQQRMWARMELAVIRGATAVVFVNDQTRDRVMRKYPESWRAKSFVVPHGYDCEHVPKCRALPQANGPLTIVYTGRFYDGLRTPEPLFRALASLQSRRPLASELRVKLVGTEIPAHRRLARSLGLTTVVEFTGRVPFARALAYAREADVLLVVDAPSEDNLFLPSKLVDYLPFNAPILALTPRRGASADLVRMLGYPVVAPDDEDAIAEAIEGLIVARQTGRLRPSPQHGDVAKQYDVRVTTAALADILERCA